MRYSHLFLKTNLEKYHCAFFKKIFINFFFLSFSFRFLFNKKMSNNALAAARRRRAQESNPPPAAINTRSMTQPNNNNNNGANIPPPPSAGGPMTLPQVIATVDRRLIVLETFMKEQKEKPSINNGGGLPPFDPIAFSKVPPSVEPSIDVPSNLKEILEEYSGRFDLIADELASLKNMLLSLQSFTMDVNKELYLKVKDAATGVSTETSNDNESGAEVEATEF